MYEERSDFVGAFVSDQLIGHAKIVYAGEAASIMQILSRLEEAERKPTNAIFAKAVELC